MRKLPGCVGALRLAACEWAAEELREQVRFRLWSLGMVGFDRV